MFFSKGEVLSKDELDMIHKSSVKILRDVGISVKHRELTSLLNQMGCKVSNGDVVKFPETVIEDMVEEMRNTTQSQVDKMDPDLAHYAGWIDGEKNEIELRCGNESLWAHDLDTNEIRPATAKDLVEATRLVDALPNVELWSWPFAPQDIPTETQDIHVLELTASNYSGWPRVIVMNPSSIKYLVEMGIVIRGSMSELQEKPCFVSSMGMSSPLQFANQCAEIALTLCKLGLKNSIPAMYTMPSCGGTAPVTLAGTLALQNAELLALNMIRKAIGIGYAYRAMPCILDLSSGSSTEAAPEALLMRLASYQLMKYYGVPSFIEASTLMTKAKLPNIQAGLEKAYAVTLAAVAGVRAFSMVGVLADGEVTSLVQIVIDAEFAEMLSRVLRGIKCGEDELALSLIEQVGIGGNFLAQEHTVKHFRNELFLPTLLDRTSAASWLQDKKDMVDVARSKVKKILEEHHPQVELDATQIKELRRIVKAADKDLAAQ